MKKYLDVEKSPLWGSLVTTFSVFLAPVSVFSVCIIPFLFSFPSHLSEVRIQNGGEGIKETTQILNVTQ